MADNDKPRIRYDDFISNIQPDPAKPESTIMLSGFVGHGPEGHARIYPDPTLGTWYDIPEDDVVYSMPIADSKLGGSYVWVRASAQIKPGSAAAPAAEAPQQAPQAAAVGINPTPATHCFVCDPKAAAQALQPTPTVQTHCFICPPPHQTPATLCTQIWCTPQHTHQLFCPTQPVVCDLRPTQPNVCGILPPSFGCTAGCQQGGAQQQPQAMRAAAAPANTAATLCTQAPACPPHTIHNSLCICPTPSAFHPCGNNTAATVCTQPPACPPHTIHNSLCICPTPSAFHPCGNNTAATVCTQGPPCPNTANTPCLTMALCFTLPGACQTAGVCPSVACTPFTPIQNGVFTPFGR
jgi:hypothetical protein